jgi:hypothetical protein
MRSIYLSNLAMTQSNLGGPGWPGWLFLLGFHGFW